jgi:hypothetical protein
MTPVPRYEIFQKLPDTQPAWVESATSLDDARDRLKQLAVMFPGDYFILDTENACFIIPRDPASGTVESDTEIALEADFRTTAGNPVAETATPEHPSKKEPGDRHKKYVPPAVRRIRIPR